MGETHVVRYSKRQSWLPVLAHSYWAVLILTLPIPATSTLIRRCFKLVSVLILCQLGSQAIQAQSSNSIEIRTPFTQQVQPDWLSQLMPEAYRFSEKSGSPPVYQGFSRDDSGDETLVGLVFLSADILPQEKGYSAPISMLIGMDTQMRLTGIKILDYRESYRYTRGDFIADLPFQTQFAGKSIMDEFRLSADVDGMSGATLSSFGISRGVRNAARQVATAYLDYQQGDAEARIWADNARSQLQLLDWDDMVAQGIVKKIDIAMPVGTLTLSITYMGRPVLGEYLIGNEDYIRAERDSSARLGSQELLLVAVGGDAASGFRMERLAISQGDATPVSINPRRFVTAGNADAAAIAGQAEYAGALALDEEVDLNQPVSIFYRAPGQRDPVFLEYSLQGLNLALYNDQAIFSVAEIARREMLSADWFSRLAYGPPWANTIENDMPWSAMPWVKITLLLFILVMVMITFFTKQSRLRWFTLFTTLIYLGFIDGGFLSVSHLTTAAAQGFSQVANNTPLVMLVVFTIVTTLLWGRIFCSTLCPFGALQDLITGVLPKRWQRLLPQAVHDKALYGKYAILGLILIAAVVASELSIFQYFEPFGTLFFLSGSLVLWIILILILVGTVIIPRFYCRYLCPLGAALAVVSLVSPFRIKRVPQCQVCVVCEHSCPTGAIRASSIDFMECVRCDICEAKLMAKAGSCQHEVTAINQRLQGAQSIRVIED